MADRIKVKVLAHIVYTNKSGAIVDAKGGDVVTLDPRDEEGLVALKAVKVIK